MVKYGDDFVSQNVGVMIFASTLSWVALVNIHASLKTAFAFKL
jgi:hypothetical protein